ncbi:hypothetical protein Tcan_00617, partial [Toxocara canis]
GLPLKIYVFHIPPNFAFSAGLSHLSATVLNGGPMNSDLACFYSLLRQPCSKAEIEVVKRWKCEHPADFELAFAETNANRPDMRARQRRETLKKEREGIKAENTVFLESFVLFT